MGKIAKHFGKLPDGDSVRLALGELVDDAGEIPAWRARDAFLLALMKVAPDCVYALVSAPEITSSFTAYLSELAGPRTHRDTEVDDKASAYYDAVAQWARDWSLAGDWIYAYAVAVHMRVARQARESPRDEDGTVTFSLPGGVLPSMIEEHIGGIVNAPVNHPRLTFGGKQVGPDPDETIWPLDVFDPDEEFDFEWNPWLESKADNMKTAVAWFKARYRAAQDAREKEAGGRKAARKPKPFYHFEWAVRYQVLRHEFVDIARDAPANLQTVIDGVRNVLAVIEMTERPRDRAGITANAAQ